jgi:hypothetical protein
VKERTAMIRPSSHLEPKDESNNFKIKRIFIIDAIKVVAVFIQSNFMRQTMHILLRN